MMQGQTKIKYPCKFDPHYLTRDNRICDILRTNGMKQKSRRL